MQLAATLFKSAPIITGIMMAGILAAIMSSLDSYLLIASSALAKNIYGGILNKKASDKQIMLVSRLTLLAIAVIGVIIALDKNSKVFTIVSFAWAGFGATFGPLVIFSLFWKRMTASGALVGMLGGGAMVFFWKFVLKPLGGVFGIYELLPAFLLSCVLIVAVSLATKKPSAAIEREFEEAKVFDF